AGSSVQLYAAGMAGNGSAPISMLNSPVVTDSTGAFTITTSYPCPYSNSVLYIVASGGSAAAPGGVSNTAAVMTAVLGQCSALKVGAGVAVDEATTIA